MQFTKYYGEAKEQKRVSSMSSEHQGEGAVMYSLFMHVINFMAVIFPLLNRPGINEVLAVLVRLPVFWIHDAALQAARKF